MTVLFTENMYTFWQGLTILYFNFRNFFNNEAFCIMTLIKSAQWQKTLGFFYRYGSLHNKSNKNK